MEVSQLARGLWPWRQMRRGISDPFDSAKSYEEEKMTLPGPSRTIIVQPIEEPVPPESVPDAEPERESEPERPAPEREPVREPVEAP